jgi:hypothetical protein
MTHPTKRFHHRDTENTEKRKTGEDPNSSKTGSSAVAASVCFYPAVRLLLLSLFSVFSVSLW